VLSHDFSSEQSCCSIVDGMSNTASLVLKYRKFVVCFSDGLFFVC